MNIIDKKHNENLLWVINEILTELKSSRDGNIVYVIRTGHNSLTPQSQAALIGELIQRRAVFLMGSPDGIYSKSFQLWANSGELFSIAREAEMSTISMEDQDNTVLSRGKLKCRLIKKDNKVIIKTPEEEIVLSTLKSEMSPDLILNYLFTMRQDTVVSIEELRGQIHFLKSVKNLSDILRKAGFTKELKEHFFPICKGDKVKLVIESELPIGLIEKIKGK